MAKSEETTSSPDLVCRDLLGEMLATLTHDLRNRLNGLMLELTDLRERLAEQGQALETDRLQERIMEISNELKKLRDRSSPTDPVFSEMPLRVWLESLPDTFASLPDGESRLEWSLDLPSEDGEFFGRFDPNLVAAALEELIRNALERDAVEPNAYERDRRAGMYAGHMLGGKVSRSVADRETVHIEARFDQDKREVSFRLSNACGTIPWKISHWGELPGVTTKRRRLGLGCVRAREVAREHGGTCTWRWDGDRESVEVVMKIPVREAEAES